MFFHFLEHVYFYVRVFLLLVGGAAFSLVFWCGLLPPSSFCVVLLSPLSLVRGWSCFLLLGDDAVFLLIFGVVLPPHPLGGAVFSTSSFLGRCTFVLKSEFFLVTLRKETHLHAQLHLPRGVPSPCLRTVVPGGRLCTHLSTFSRRRFFFNCMSTRVVTYSTC